MGNYSQRMAVQRCLCTSKCSNRIIVHVCKRSCLHSILQYPPDCFTIRVPLELAHACLTHEHEFVLLRYDVSVALFPLALFIYAIFKSKGSGLKIDRGSPKGVKLFCECILPRNILLFCTRFCRHVRTRIC